VFVLIPAMTLAENPDSRPSITLGLSGGLASLDYEMGVADQDGDAEQIDLSAGLKLPVSENATLNFALAFAAGNTEWKENFFYYRSKTDHQRFSFGFSATFYIGQSINK